MGFDTSRFADDEVDQELICAICSCVLEEPLQAPVCEHAFCSICIKEWLSRKTICPIDRQPLTLDDLKPPPKILRNLLSRLNIACDNAEYGCQEVVRLESLSSHSNKCEFNPKRPIECDKGCGLIIPKDEMQQHNCIKDLRSYFESELMKYGQKYDELKECLISTRNVLKEMFPKLNDSTNLGLLAKQLWCYSLPRARVLRWGGLLSTPDSGLQATVKKSLIESGCPQVTVNELMENSHERKWPPGLSTLEIRQMNRSSFDKYVCRKIPGQQAVVVVSCENRHMNDDMILEPGIIMIFAYGIELMEPYNLR